MIPRDVVETVAIVALFIISSGLCALVGYALGRMRGEDPPERLLTYEVLRTPPTQWHVEYYPPAVSPAPEPATATSPDVTAVSVSGGATAVSGAAVAVVDARGQR